MRKIRGDKPVEVIIRTCMEIPQGNSLCLSQTSKNVIFYFFTLFFFSSKKLENRRAEQVLPGRGRAGTSGREKMLVKGCRRVNAM
jgi:hypothetical protein